MVLKSKTKIQQVSTLEQRATNVDGNGLHFSTDLLPNTEYLISLVCVYEQRESSPVVGTQTTGGSKRLGFTDESLIIQR